MLADERPEAQQRGGLPGQEALSNGGGDGVERIHGVAGVGDGR